MVRHAIRAGGGRREQCLLEANLDEGAMWPTAFAPKELTAAEEARIGVLVKKAVSGELSNPMATERASSSSSSIQVE